MAEIYRNGRFEADTWTLLDHEQPVPDGAAVIVPLRRWLAGRESLAARPGDIGVLVEAGDDVQLLAPDLRRFAVIALAFPKFSDGRNYSSARILREELVYHGELRAVGDVLIDQIPFMRRCGIDAFAVSHAPTRAALEAGATHEVTRYYQPVGAGGETIPADTRPWLRVPNTDNTSKTEQA